MYSRFTACQTFKERVMNKIFISTDSTADVTDEIGREFSLSFIRFSVGTRAFCFPDRIYSPDDALDCFL